MEKKMENDMEPVVIKVLYGDQSIQIIPTLGPNVCKSYLHWAIGIPRAHLKLQGHPYLKPLTGGSTLANLPWALNPKPYTFRSSGYLGGCLSSLPLLQAPGKSYGKYSPISPKPLDPKPKAPKR